MNLLFGARDPGEAAPELILSRLREGGLLHLKRRSLDPPGLRLG
jgi:hypothetical protein